jgi:hypothetical protein
MDSVINTYQFIIQQLLNELDRKDIVVKYFKENGNQSEKDIVERLLYSEQIFKT